MQQSIAVVGAGKIGVLITALLSESSDYKVYLLDKTLAGDRYGQLVQRYEGLQTAVVDAQNKDNLAAYLRQHQIQRCEPWKGRSPDGE